MHYVLDVAFGEDGSRLRKEKGPENMAIMRKLALTVTMSDKKTKSSIIGGENRRHGQMTILSICSFNPN
jgi:hypothetical protein